MAARRSFWGHLHHLIEIGNLYITTPGRRRNGSHLPTSDEASSMASSDIAPLKFGNAGLADFHRPPIHLLDADGNPLHTNGLACHNLTNAISRLSVTLRRAHTTPLWLDCGDSPPQRLPAPSCCAFNTVHNERDLSCQGSMHQRSSSAPRPLVPSDNSSTTTTDGDGADRSNSAEKPSHQPALPTRTPRMTASAAGAALRILRAPAAAAAARAKRPTAATPAAPAAPMPAIIHDFLRLWIVYQAWQLLAAAAGYGSTACSFIYQWGQDRQP
jgi:hypothetical protein